MLLENQLVFQRFGLPKARKMEVRSLRIIVISALLLYLGLGFFLSMVYTKLTNCDEWLSKANIFVLPIIIGAPLFSIYTAFITGIKGVKMISFNSAICIALLLTPIILNTIAHILVLTGQKQIGMLVYEYRFESVLVVLIAALLYKIMRKDFFQTHTLL